MTTQTTARMGQWRTELQPLDAILVRYTEALTVVDRMCQQGRWAMCVPPQLDDSDVTITEALEQIPLLIARIRELERRPLSEDEIAAIEARYDAARSTTT